MSILIYKQILHTDLMGYYCQKSELSEYDYFCAFNEFELYFFLWQSLRIFSFGGERRYTVYKSVLYLKLLQRTVSMGGSGFSNKVSYDFVGIIILNEPLAAKFIIVFTFCTC